MKIKLSNILSFALLSMLIGCTNGFDEINTNPNASLTMSADALINQSITGTRTLFGGRFNREVTVNYAHYYNPGGGEFQKYGYVQTINDLNWHNFYLQCIQPSNNIVEQYGTNAAYKNRVNIAKIFQAYIYSQGVAIWGPMPKSQALKGNTTVPYDTEESIYTQLISELKTSIAALDVNGDKFQLVADPIYGSDVKKWKKFGNSLLLRLYVRLSDCATGSLADSIMTHASYLLNNPSELIASNAEEAASRFGTYSDTWSDLYDVFVYNKANLLAETTPVMCETFMLYTEGYDDPRITAFASPCKTGKFIGSYFGKPKAGAFKPKFISSGGTAGIHTNKISTDYSFIGTEYLRPDAEYVYLGFPEVCFLKAELALKAWGGKGDADAQTAYEAGIDASFSKLNLDATAYKTYGGISWGIPVANTDAQKKYGADPDTITIFRYKDWMNLTSSAVDNKKFPTPAALKLYQVVMQEWIALYPNGLDAWTLHRRTQLLELPPHFAPANTALTYGSGYTFIPNRLLYPTNEYQTNSASVTDAITKLAQIDKVDGLDNMDTRLWFAKPQKKTFNITSYPGFPHN